MTKSKSCFVWLFNVIANAIIFSPGGERYVFGGNHALLPNVCVRRVHDTGQKKKKHQNTVRACDATRAYEKYFGRASSERNERPAAVRASGPVCGRGARFHCCSVFLHVRTSFSSTGRSTRSRRHHPR